MALPSTRLGFIIPSTNFVAEPNIWASLPDDVSAHFSRVLVTGRRMDGDGYPEVWAQSNEHLGTAVLELASARVHALCYAVTAGSFFGGRRWDEEWRDRVSQDHSIPATSTSWALVEAVRASGLEKISVVTAFVDRQNEILEHFLREHDLDVRAIAGLGDVRIQQPATETPERMSKLIATVIRPETEAVLVCCAGLDAMSSVEQFEEQFELPVFTSNQVALWSALRASQYSGELIGPGSLLTTSSEPV
jgi:maleate cis-trans isomerase